MNYKDVVVDLIRAGGYIPLNKKAVKVFGLNGAVFLSVLLDKFFYFENKTTDDWFFTTMEKLSVDTGMSLRTLRKQKKSLASMGIITTELRGIPPKEHYKVDFEKVYAMMFDSNLASNPIPVKSDRDYPVKSDRDYPVKSDRDYPVKSDRDNIYSKNTCSKNTSSNPKLSKTKDIIVDNDFSSQENTNSQGNPDSQENTEYQEIAKELAEIVMSAKNIKVNTAKIKQWGNEIRKLHSVDGIEPGRMRSVLSWYSSNIGGEYVPIVESGKSFRSKFLRLENAVKRDSSNPSSPKPRPKPEFIDTSEKSFQEVYNANKVSRTDMFQEYCNIPLNALLLETDADEVDGVCPRICVDGRFMGFHAKRMGSMNKFVINVNWVDSLSGLTKFPDFFPFAT